MLTHRVALARNAMATRWEIVLEGNEPPRLRAAGEEALDEIDRQERRLSLFLPASDISHVNARAHLGPVPVAPPLFALLTRATELGRLTDGAFDITVGPLMSAWGFRNEPAKPADSAANLTGSQYLALNPEHHTIHFLREGMSLDLGAIGKGWALDAAADILREAGVTRAILHGGTSSVTTIGDWFVDIADPDEPGSIAARVNLRSQSLGVSSPSGRLAENRTGIHGHVMDPRTGRPAAKARLAAVVSPSAADADALSTALLVLGGVGVPLLTDRFPQARFLVIPAGTPPGTACHFTGGSS